MDIAPTILNIADAQYPSEYKGKVNKPMDGISMSGIFNGDFSCDTERSLGFELNGAKSVRRGDFKISQAGNSGNHIGLYNVVNDPFEQSDLSTQSPNLYRELLGLYQKYAEDSGVVEINSVYLREELADPSVTTAKIRGGSSAINSAKLTGNFRTEGSFKSSASISIAGEIRPEAAHVGQFGEIYITAKDTTSGRSYALTSSGFVESANLISFQAISELPKMVTLAIFDGILSSSIFNTPANFEITLSYKLSDGTLIDNAAKPLKIAITE